MIARWLRRLADWLDPPPPPKRVRTPYADTTRLFMEQAEIRLGPGFGDAKRRDVYAALMKVFPQARKRDLAYAIEQIMQEWT